MYGLPEPGDILYDAFRNFYLVVKRNMKSPDGTFAAISLSKDEDPTYHVNWDKKCFVKSYKRLKIDKNFIEQRYKMKINKGDIVYLHGGYYLVLNTGELSSAVVLYHHDKERMYQLELIDCQKAHYTGRRIRI